MTEQEMRVAIAEACGWKRHKTQFGYEWEDPEGRRGFVRQDEDRGGNYLVSAPDYPSDLNAMHEAEDIIYASHPTYVRYESILIDMVLHPLRATAKERAEAFCRTLFPERFKE